MATARLVAEDSDERPRTDLPLREFLAWAAYRNREHLQRRAKSGQFLSPLFEFIRYAKAHPGLANVSAEEALHRVQDIPWRDWFPDSEDPQSEFLVTWDRVRVPAWSDILELATSIAKEKPLRPRSCISPAYGHYLSIAGRLQELRPNDYINLPVVRLGQLLGLEPRTIGYHAARAKKDGYLTLVAKHHPLSHQAARYTFDCERFNMETGEENPAEEESHFHKDSKDYKDTEDLKDSHDQRENNRTEKENKGREGLPRLVFDSKRNLGNEGAGFSSERRGKSTREQRKLLQTQVTLVKQRFERSGSLTYLC